MSGSARCPGVGTSRIVLVVLVVAALALGGCGTRQEVVAARLIDDPRGAIPALDEHVDFTLHRVWEAPIFGERALAAWSFYVPDGPALAARGGGIDAAPLSHSQYLVWTGDLEGGAVEALRFRFQLPLAGQAELYWNAAGEDFAPQRYALQPPDPADPRQVTFDLGPLRSWSGRVARIGIRLLGNPLTGQALLRAEGLRYSLRSSLGAGETRYVSLDGHGMAAWLARPGVTLRRRLTIPPGAKLRLPVSAWLTSGESARIRVLARREHGEILLADQVLLPSIQPPRHSWTRIVADLSQLAGETVELAFETSPGTPGSFVLWGNPRLVRASSSSRPSVILISLDTVRADHLSLYGYPRPTTPNLERWAKRRATVFETAVASAPWTLPSHVSMLSGLDAIHHGVNRHGPIPPEITLVPQRFRDAGYATFGTTAGLLLTPEMGFARGFDEFHVRGRMQSLPEWDGELGAGVDETLGWLDRHRDRRFFLFFHTYEAHSPYEAREPFFSRLGGVPAQLNAGGPVWMEEDGFEALVRPRYRLVRPESYEAGVHYGRRTLAEGDRALATALYDSGLAYIDAQLGRLFDYLEQEGRLDDTLVVVTSDHGEALFEHGGVGHGTLYDHDLLVPLVIAAPFDAAHGRRVASQVRSVDIAPTLLELAGLRPQGGIDGASLAGAMRGQPTPARDAWSYALSTLRGVSLRLGASGRKVIAQDTVFEPFRGGLEVYDLKRDPKELHDLAASPTRGAGFEPQRLRLTAEPRPDSGAIRIQIVNHGPSPFAGLIGGNTIDAMIVSPELRAACCASTPGGVSFEVPPGGELSLVLPGRRVAGDLRVLLLRPGPPFRLDLPIGNQAVRWKIARERGRWTSGSAPAASPQSGDRVGLEIEHHETATREGRDDARLREALRALGYIR